MAKNKFERHVEDLARRNRGNPLKTLQALGGMSGEKIGSLIDDDPIQQLIAQRKQEIVNERPDLANDPDALHEEFRKRFDSTWKPSLLSRLCFWRKT